MQAPNSNVPVSTIGSANVYQGSQISTLNTIPANSNITFRADDEPFNLYKQTTLDNTFLLSTFETFGVTSQAISGTNETSSYTFQFTLPNWSNTRDAFLEWPVNIFTSTLPNQADDVILTGNDPMLLNNTYVTSGLKYVNNTPIKENLPGGSFLGGQFPNEAIIQTIKSVQVYGATNNQPLGKTTMFDQPNLSTIGLFERENNTTATINGYSGLPISGVKFYPASYIKNAENPESNGNYDTTFLGGEHPRARMVNKNASTSFEATVRCASVAVVGTKKTAGDGGNVFNNKVIISIPLWKLSEFFRTNKSLPPEFRFKITITFYNAAKVLWVGGSWLEGIPGIVYGGPNTTVAPVIKTRTFVLNPTVQEGLNLKWARNVFTYDLETCEPFIIPSSQYPYRTKTIQTSMQRPLMLRICVHATKDNLGDTTKSFPVRYFANSLVPWIDSNFNNIAINEININISGKPVIRYENDTLTQNGWIPTGFDNIIDLYNQRNGMAYSVQPGNVCPRIYPMSFANGYTGAPIDIPISPGMLWDNTVYPTDQGAIQIQLSINTSAQLHPDFQITVYKLYTQQISVDTNLKATLTEWPARVVQNQGQNSTLIQPNVIPGN